MVELLVILVEIEFFFGTTSHLPYLHNTVTAQHFFIVFFVRLYKICTIKFVPWRGKNDAPFKGTV